MADVLTLRRLNRATLARQLLLERSTMPVADTVAHLVGLQAQEPLNPYTALWSRLAGFDPETLAGLLVERRAVRIVLMRGTIHLVTAEDCVGLRALFQPVLDRELARHRDHAPVLAGIDLAPVLHAGREILAEPRTGPQLRAALADRFPRHPPAALAFACRNLLGLVQVPPRGLWGRTAQVTVATAESWLGRPLEARPSIDAAARRYLAAFGPSSVADVAAWSGLTGLREVLDRLRPRLRTFADERGRELFDLPDAPRPDPDTPAPVRFLPEYDNVLLSHDDRGRFLGEDTRRRLSAGERTVRGSVLHDGGVAGTWRPEGDGLVVDHAAPLPKRAQAAIAAEARRLLRFLAPGVTPGDVRFVRLG